MNNKNTTKRYPRVTKEIVDVKTPLAKKSSATKKVPRSTSLSDYQKDPLAGYRKAMRNNTLGVGFGGEPKSGSNIIKKPIKK